MQKMTDIDAAKETTHITDWEALDFHAQLATYLPISLPTDRANHTAATSSTTRMPRKV
jgi:hypothetical protein